MTDKPVFQPDWGKGFSAGVRYWLFFMICFFVLGYDWLFSIVLGAIGAIATSVIGAWWNAKEDDNATDKPTQEVEKGTKAHLNRPLRGLISSPTVQVVGSDSPRVSADSVGYFAKEFDIASLIASGSSLCRAKHCRAKRAIFARSTRGL